MAIPTYGGDWTSQKLDVLTKYMNAYTTALKKQHFRLIYVDAFAGAGRYKNPEIEDPELSPGPSIPWEGGYDEMQHLHEGSPVRALEVTDKPFDRLIFVDNDQDCVQSLRELETQNPKRDIEIHMKDANDFIPEFCESMGENDRGLVFLDPFATQVSWNTVEAIAETKKLDCWILFPLMAIARLMPVQSLPESKLEANLDRVFGERKHWIRVYHQEQQFELFDNKPGQTCHRNNREIATRYKSRLEKVFYKVADTKCTLKTHATRHCLNSFSQPVIQKVPISQFG